jgi:hypothetical protein
MSLVREAQKQIVTSKSISGAAGKGMVVAGGSGLALWFVAGLLPFISLPMLLIGMVVFGLFIME